MSIYDILMLAVLVGSILFGLWKGLAWQVASLASIFVSYFIALNFSGPLSTVIAAQEPWNRFAAMLILFLGTSLIIWMGYGYMKKSIERLRLRGFDTQAGGILGAFKGAVLCMLITLFAVTLFGTNVKNAVIASKSGGYIATAINRLSAMVPAEIEAVLNDHVEKFNQDLDDHSPNWVAESEVKFDQKLQTIRGKFKLPSNRSQFTNMQENVPANGPAKHQNNNGESDLRDTVTGIGGELFNAAKQAGKTAIEDSFKR